MIDVIFLPDMLPQEALSGSQAVVLDVLRASTTIVTALAHGARAVRLFNDINQAADAKAETPAPVFLAGERRCVKIPGFDLGNSPAEYVTHTIGNGNILLTTSNGTRAVFAARGARRVFIGSLLNASATAHALLEQLDEAHTFLVCAGTDGRVACEDVIGAGGILWHLLQQTYRTDLPFTDTAWLAYHAYGAVRQRLPAALRLGIGGIQLIEAGFEDDIDLCAALDTQNIVVEVQENPMRAVRAEAR